VLELLIEQGAELCPRSRFAARGDRDRAPGRVAVQHDVAGRPSRGSSSTRLGRRLDLGTELERRRRGEHRHRLALARVLILGADHQRRHPAVAPAVVDLRGELGELDPHSGSIGLAGASSVRSVTVPDAHAWIGSAA